MVYEVNGNKKVFLSKLFFYLLITCIKVHLVQSQISSEFALTPSTLTVRLGDFTLLLQSSAGGSAVTCSIYETDDPGSSESTLNWRLLNPTFTTVAGNSTRLYPINVQQLPPSPLNATDPWVVVSCCDASDSSSTLISVNLVSYMEGSNDTVPIVFPNPAYLNIAPCPCDLTLGRCDINCCCDQECSADFIAGFTCIAGPFGGNYLVDDVNYCNTSQSLLGHPWHQFMCIESINMRYMGMFYTNADGSLSPLNTIEAFQSKLQSVDSTYTYKDVTGTNRYILLPPEYHQGDLVYFRESGTTLNRFFSLPQNLADGGCVRDGSITYLGSLDSACSVKVTGEMCASGTVLDPATYLTDGSTLEFTSLGTAVPVQVIYYCVAGTEYTRSGGNGTSGRYNSTGSSLFPSGTTGTGLVACTASFGVVGGICEDAVVNVTYELRWNGTQITGVNATIYLADVAIVGSTDNDVVTQSFQAGFRHELETVGTQYRSGNPGYDVGLPILASENRDDSFYGTPYLYLWKPTGNGLCVNAELQQVGFGRDQSSGCIVRLTLPDFDECEILRLRFESALESLFSTAKFVSRFGDPEETGSDVVDIIFDSTTNSSLYSNTTAVSKYSGRCDNIPVAIVYQFVYSETGMAKGYPIREVLSVRIGYIRETLKLGCVESGACDVTTDAAESFAVSSTTTFTQVDATQQSTLSLNDRRSNHTCAKDATCWHELFLPLTTDLYFMQPTDAKYREMERNYLYALLIMLVGIGVVLISLDWDCIGRFCHNNIPF